MKWGFVPKDSAKPKYLCINADEGEPGTFKDRVIMENDPHLMIEGAIIAAFAIGVHNAYIYLRGEFQLSAERISQALKDCYKEGFLGKNILGKGFDLDIVLFRGAGAYICGEETALIESIEGKQGKPRLKPPFPAVVGLFMGPTVVNNVETLATVPYIITNGAQEFKKFGTEKSPGTKLFCVSGMVKKPGVYELPLGFPLKRLIDETAGGIKDGKKLKAVIPGGSSTPVLRAEEAEKVTLDFEALAACGSMLGSGGVIVLTDDVCMVKALTILVQFYAHESCGQCSPCREGTGWAAKVLIRIEKGEGKEGDADLLLSIARNMAGKTICPLSDACAMPINSFVTKFRDEFESHIRDKRCQL
jgi:NADH-quinone oxidoreductase subunit F